MIRKTKKRAVRAVLALLLPVMILTQAGCTKPGDDTPDTVNVRVDGAAEDGKFNQGLVEYKKDTVVHVSDAYDTSLAGQIVDRKAVGAEVLFEADFADGDVTVGDDAQARDVNAVGIADGVHERGTLDDTAMADIIAGTLRLHVAMGVIKMKYGQTLLG